ncbi:helix-turn-helix domain-containing protein [Pseudomonas sp. GX19020]|uniref:helix-turn-helix domain-containing protein n=1 Tax=Pseudomonas sp. GX19020 TaxID=2942277 RepID=UPI0020186B62|nr:helix-turn-helix domain-containing protein [Pseudomonas sp. GX19020]MCL4068774.1 helix-turn-helix domain-containing protein [Pseudomonas sp. GX19020]
MTYSDKVRAEIAARYGVPVRCQVKIIPPGVIAEAYDPWAPAGSVRRGRQLTAKDRRKIVEMRDGGASFRQIGRHLNRSTSLVYSVAGCP